MEENMTYEEFLKWFQYFERRPVGWREDDRTYKLLQAQGLKATPGVVFPSLKNLYNREKPLKGLKNSFFFQKLLSAKGGDRLDILEQ
jgi:hypothetical protein